MKKSFTWCNAHLLNLDNSAAARLLESKATTTATKPGCTFLIMPGLKYKATPCTWVRCLFRQKLWKDMVKLSIKSIVQMKKNWIFMKLISCSRDAFANAKIEQFIIQQSLDCRTAHAAKSEHDNWPNGWSLSAYKSSGKQYTTFSGTSSCADFFIFDHWLRSRRVIFSPSWFFVCFVNFSLIF